MERRAIKATARALLGCLLTSCGLLAQNGPDSDPDAARGYTNSVFHHGSIDSINLYNGQLTVPIAIGPAYSIGPSLKFQASLYYTSQVWEFGHPQPPLPQDQPRYEPYRPLHGNPALGIGWNFGLGAVKNCSVSQAYKCYVSPDGAEHLFNFPVGSAYFKTRDADQLVLHFLNGANESAGFEMWDGSGSRYVFTKQVLGYDDLPTVYVREYGRGRDGWYLTSLSDPFGNSLTVDYYTSAQASPCPSLNNDATCTATWMKCQPSSPTSSWIPQRINLPGGAHIDVGLTAGQMIASFTFPVFANGASGSAVWNLDYQSVG
ncbi:MAG: hypothetical protein ACRD1B_03760, partial [Thermoanaerobaculia bacterium]